MRDDADNIFIGTVKEVTYSANEKNMPLSVVSFRNIEVAQNKNGVLDLQYAGGVLNNKTIRVTHTPSLKPNVRYLIFSHDKGRGEMNPLLGHKAMYRIVKDANTTDEYLMLDGHFVTGIDGDRIQLSAKKVLSIANGIAIIDESRNPHEFMQYARATDGREAKPLVTYTKDEEPLTLNKFKTLLASQYSITFKAQSSTFTSEPANEGMPGQKTTGTLSVGAFRYLPAAMKQVPTSSTPWYSLNAASMNNWNNVVNIYQSIPGTGHAALTNGYSEFGGFPTNAELTTYFGSGYSWSTGEVAFTVPIGGSSANEIGETDIFANPGYTYTDNPWDQVKGTAFVYKAVISHELGHAWGFQVSGNESYDYGVPTVMQGISYGIYENGIGVHAIDAAYVRLDYNNLTTIPNIVDLGVESYYAVDGTGLKPATTATAAKAGDSISISGITVENMSNSDLSNVVVRFFLSKDSLYDAGDYALSPGYVWATFAKEAMSTSASYEVTIPGSTPAGQYYVGAMVTYNTSTSDPLTGNNVAFLPAKLRVLSNPNTDVVNVNSASADIAISKLPAKGSYKIMLNGVTAGKANLYNSVGQLISTQELSETTITLPASDDLYLLEVVTPNGKKTFKLTNY
ncbi:MAG: hypothetical protein BGO70_05265 [Bacteroidetes bacterium 43-93]|nr:MAG: hypothetical protein BGO70_05265 [Bacteroidetes bacterium 43-93]